MCVCQAQGTKGKPFEPPASPTIKWRSVRLIPRTWLRVCWAAMHFAEHDLFTLESQILNKTARTYWPLLACSRVEYAWQCQATRTTKWAKSYSMRQPQLEVTCAPRECLVMRLHQHAEIAHEQQAKLKVAFLRKLLQCKLGH